MQPELPQEESPQLRWPEAVDPALVQRLVRPLIQPGVIHAGLAQQLLSRHQEVARRLPLLSALERRWGITEAASAGQLPVVYAQPAPVSPAGSPSSSDTPAAAIQRAVVQPVQRRPAPVTTPAAPTVAPVAPVITPAAAAPASSQLQPNSSQPPPPANPDAQRERTILRPVRRVRRPAPVNQGASDPPPAASAETAIFRRYRPANDAPSPQHPEGYDLVDQPAAHRGLPAMEGNPVPTVISIQRTPGLPEMPLRHQAGSVSAASTPARQQTPSSHRPVTAPAEPLPLRRPETLAAQGQSAPSGQSAPPAASTGEMPVVRAARAAAPAGPIASLPFGAGGWWPSMQPAVLLNTSQAVTLQRTAKRPVVTPLTAGNRQEQAGAAGLLGRSIASGTDAVYHLPLDGRARRQWAASQSSGPGPNLPAITPQTLPYTPASGSTMVQRAVNGRNPDGATTTVQRVIEIPEFSSSVVAERPAEPSAGVDVDNLAQQVWRRLVRRLDIEAERRGRPL